MAVNKGTNMRYSRTFTFGRFNIPHYGHVELIEKMLKHGDRVMFFLSSGKLNNEYDLRVLLLRHLCRFQNLDLDRVYFLKASGPFVAALETVSEAPYKEACLVLGSDQQQLGLKISDQYDVNFIANPRTCSSSRVRLFMGDSQFEEDLKALYKGDSYSVRLAGLLRKEELNREESQNSKE